MSSSSKFSYQRLRKLPAASTIEEDEEEQRGRVLETPAGGGRRRAGSWLRVRRRRRWRRPRVRIAGLGRAVRRKAAAAVRKVVKRLREGRPYIGDLFAGNYMFMQVTPASPAGPTLPLKPHFYGAASLSSSSSSSTSSRFSLSTRVVS